MTDTCRVKLSDPKIGSNKAELHCTGGTVLSFFGNQILVELYLSDDKVIELRDHLNWIIKFDKLEERE